MKNVLVTGGSGFLGWHIVNALAEKDVQCHAPNRHGYDLISPLTVQMLVRRAPYDTVIHCAARMGGLGDSSKHPGEFFYQNLMMGMNVIEQARLAGVEKIVLIGSICSYPKNAPIPFKEDDLWNGNPEENNAAYGHAKRMLIVQAQAYRKQYGLNSIVLIPANMYGPRDNFNLETSHVIPALIRKVDEAIKTGAEFITLWGDGTPTREFLYVEDAAKAVVMAAENYYGAEPVNLGTGHSVAMDTLSSVVCSLMGYKGRVLWDTSKPNGQPKRQMDVSRAVREFGFTSTTNILEGLDKTIAWYRAQP